MKFYYSPLIWLMTGVLVGAFSSQVQSQSTAGQGLFVVPGTNVLLQAPPGFEHKAGTTKLVKEETGLIHIMDLAGADFSRSSATFSKKNLEQRGVVVYDNWEGEIDGYSARLVHISTDDPSMSSYSVAFGDHSFCVLAITKYPAEDKEMGAQLREALLNAKYAKEKTDHFEAAPFTIDDTKSEFDFDKYSDGMWLFSPKVKESQQKEPLVGLTVLPTYPSQTLEMLATGAVEQLGKELGKSVIPTKASKEDFNGFPSHVVQGTVDDPDGPRGVYLQFLDLGTKLLFVKGFFPEGTKDKVSELEALLRTVKVK